MSKKKGFRGTAILGVFVTFLAVYTAWEYKKAQDSVGVAPEEKKIFTLKSEEINKIKITNKDGNLVLERKDGEWQILEPTQDMAEESAVDALLYSLTIQKGKNFRTDDSKDNGPAEYGLDKPAAVIELSGAGKTENLSISNKNAFDGSYYISQNGETFLGDRGLAHIVTRDLKVLRSRHLWRVGDAEIVNAEVTLNDGKNADKYMIKKVDGVMQVEPQPKFKVEPKRVIQWLNSLESATAVEWMTDKPTEEDKRNFLLLKPSFNVKIHYKKKDGTEGDWTFTAGQDRAEDVFAYSNVRDAVYKYTRKGLKDVRVGRDYFRDMKAPFKFPVEQAAEIEILQGGFHRKFKKEGSDWKLEGEDAKDYQLNTDKLVSMIQTLTNVEASEFFPPSEAKGFKAGEKVSVRDNKGSILFELSWGDEYKGKKPFNDGMNLRMVKANTESDAMGIDGMKFKNLIDPTLVSKKEKK